MLKRTIGTGLAGAVASTVALAIVSVAEGHAPAQPLNATSHWLHGNRAARRRRIDGRHTGVGLATHVLACVFWAAFLEVWLRRRPARGPGDLAGRAAAVSVLAAAVDYTITPKRFTPGWELVVSPQAMAAVYAAMAAGFFASRL